MKSRFSAETLKRTALFSLLFFFAAHAFCFFNLTFSGASVMLDVSKGRSAQLAAGQFLLPYYLRLRGTLSAPMLVGMLSALYLSAACMLSAALLGLKKPLHLMILCGVLTVSPAMTALFAASLHTADAACLALLCAAAAACCLRMRLGFLPGAGLLAAAMALEPSSAAFFAGLCLLALLRGLLSASSAKGFAWDAAKAAAALLPGIALWLAGYMLLAKRNGVGMSFPFAACGPAGAWRSALGALTAPLTAYPRVSILLRALLLLAAAAGVLPRLRTLSKPCMALTAAVLLLLPAACAPALFGAQVIPACALMDVLPLVLLAHMPERHARIRHAAACAFGVLFMGLIVFSNQVYLKKNLEFESAISLTSRIIQRAEETEGYEPGFTPVAIIGTPEDSVYSVPRRGFEHLSALDAARANTAVTSEEEMIWYCWEVLGYPFNFVSTYEAGQLADADAVRAMPAFPAADCCRMIDGVLVIKLQ